MRDVFVWDIPASPKGEKMDNGADCYNRFLSGDKDAIEEIIRDYKDGLVFYLFNIVGNIHRAEELTIDTFVKLFYERPKYKGRCSFKTWLYSIGRYTALDYIRKNKRVSEFSIDDALDISDGENLERDYIKNEERYRLRQTINRLKPEYSQVLYLIYFEGFDTSETAKIMDKSNKQITDLLYRAKAALKKEIEKEGYKYDGL